MNRRLRIMSSVLAGCLVGALVKHWTLVGGVIRTVSDDALSPGSRSGSLEYLVVVGGFLVLLVASLVGLAGMKRWGVYAAYALVPVSTILHGIALIPFISDLLPSQTLKIAAVFILNLGFMIAVVVLHMSLARGSRRLNTAPG